MAPVSQQSLMPLKTQRGFRRPPAASRLSIGDRAPYFSMLGTDQRRYSISDFEDCPALAVIFIGNRCPHTKRIVHALSNLHNLYAPLGFQLVAVCSNDGDSYPEDSFKSMTEMGSRIGFSFPYLHDEDQQAAKAYDAACTPEAFLFGKELQLQYHGQPDVVINRNATNEKISSTEHSAFVRAIDAVLFGRRPDVQYTSCIGSSIKWKASLRR